MAFNNSDDNESISEINVVPLVDIILVVLIIFMVTAPTFMKQTISVNLPKAASGEQTVPSKLDIALTADGKIMINGSEATEADLQRISLEEVAKNADVQAIISADKNVSHGKVVMVLDVVKGAGVKKFALSIDKK